MQCKSLQFIEEKVEKDTGKMAGNSRSTEKCMRTGSQTKVMYNVAI